MFNNSGYIYETRDLHHIRLSYAYASFEELNEGLNVLLELTQH
jgi:GntR family transcriptional regulator of abcA and norABC